jgi:C_GCAxxG_C_C family probable redox protein
MTMSERAVEYYLKQDRNCAEAVLLAAGDSLGFSLPPDAVRALGTFGGGMGCGETCGAAAGAVAALGLLLIHGKAHDSPEARKAAAAFTQGFVREFGTLRCAQLKPVQASGSLRCASLVAAAADRLEALCSSPASPV